MVPIQNVKIAVGPEQNCHDTETVISVPVWVLGPQRARSEIAATILLRTLQHNLIRLGHFFAAIAL